MKVLIYIILFTSFCSLFSQIDSTNSEVWYGYTNWGKGKSPFTLYIQGDSICQMNYYDKVDEHLFVLQPWETQDIESTYALGKVNRKADTIQLTFSTGTVFTGTISNDTVKGKILHIKTNREGTFYLTRSYEEYKVFYNEYIINKPRLVKVNKDYVSFESDFALQKGYRLNYGVQQKTDANKFAILWGFDRISFFYVNSGGQDIYSINPLFYGLSYGLESLLGKESIIPKIPDWIHRIMNPYVYYYIYQDKVMLVVRMTTDILLPSKYLIHNELTAGIKFQYNRFGLLIDLHQNPFATVGYDNLWDKLRPNTLEIYSRAALFYDF